MKLYHGSNITVETIDLGKCRPYKDFGKGFYLTDIEAQATFSKVTSQFFFHTEAAINFLKRI